MTKCPYRTPCGVCRPMAEITGQVSRVAEAVDCAIGCPRAQGPRTTGIVTPRFVEWSIRRVVNGPTHRPVTIRRHLDATVLHRPIELDAIREAFDGVYPFSRVYLTGSAILQPHRPIKDIDVTVLLEDPGQRLAIEERLPGLIGSARLDVFFRLRLNPVYCYVALDLSHASVPDAARVAVPFVGEVRTTPEAPIGTILRDAAMKVPEGAWSTLPAQRIPDDFDPRAEYRGCCDPPAQKGDEA